MRTCRNIAHCLVAILCCATVVVPVLSNSTELPAWADRIPEAQGFSSQVSNSGDAYWQAFGPSGGPDESIHSLTVLDGVVFGGGNLFIGKWDGVRWSSFDSADGDVRALAVYDGKVIAAGTFTTIGTTAANYIAAWDPSTETWFPLGSGMEKPVSSLTVYDGELIAGGQFFTAGGVMVNYIGAWDGSAWSSMGLGLGGDTYALTVYDGQLIAGGVFNYASGVLVNKIAAWDGSSWAALGFGTSNDVHALTVYDGKLIAGGAFTGASGVPVNRIAAWDGSSWAPLGLGVDELVKSLAVRGGQLIAGGQFTAAGGASANFIASWDGASWAPMGVGMDDYVLTFAVSEDELFAGGDFTTADGVPCLHAGRWDGSAWLPLGNGLSAPAHALAVYDGEIIAGGEFTRAGGVTVNHIGAWTGSGWAPLGTGTNGDVMALIEYGGSLVAGGAFTEAGGVPVVGIAAWDGSSWSAMGTNGLDEVDAFTVFDGALIAGGIYDAYASWMATVVRFNGTYWEQMCPDCFVGVDTPVRALAVYNGELYCAHQGYVRRWAEYLPGDSLFLVDGRTNGSVNALAVYDGELVAGGSFSTVNNIPASKIATWNGASWDTLGSGVSGWGPEIWALTCMGDLLVAGGWFSEAGGVDVRHVAAWDGTAWSPLGTVRSGVLGDPAWPFQYGSVFALAVQDYALYVGGTFEWAGATGAWEPSENIAAWHESVTGIHDEPDFSPSVAILEQNFPNPFNPSTTIRFNVPPPGSVVSLAVYDVAGRLVATLIDNERVSGPQEVRWDGKDRGGTDVASGVYFYRLIAGKEMRSRKLVILR